MQLKLLSKDQLLKGCRIEAEMLLRITMSDSCKRLQRIAGTEGEDSTIEESP